MRDGRRIFDNLVRSFANLIAFHPPLLITAVVVPLLDKPLLLLPIELVVLELLLHPIVALVFQADPADRDAMCRPPRPVMDALRLRALRRPYAVGLTLAVAIITVHWLELAEHVVDRHAVGAPVGPWRRTGHIVGKVRLQ